MEAAVMAIELDALGVDANRETRLSLVFPARRAARACCFLIACSKAP
jgi:hypothetical protein